VKKILAGLEDGAFLKTIIGIIGALATLIYTRVAGEVNAHGVKIVAVETVQSQNTTKIKNLEDRASEDRRESKESLKEINSKAERIESAVNDIRVSIERIVSAKTR
jgi:peptidoglycan hydrolase CwlO-like protein